MKVLGASAALMLLAGCSGVETRATAEGCTLLDRERFDAFFFGQRVRPQPVYRNGDLIGWRVYEQHNNEVLPKLGLQVGDLVTHFCGEALPAILSGDGRICCSKPVGVSVPLTVVRNDKVHDLQSPMPPNNPLQATRETRAPER